jgi:hypothetical protein
MIVGRNPRNPVIDDTVLFQPDNRRRVGPIVGTHAAEGFGAYRVAEETDEIDSCA